MPVKTFLAAVEKHLKDGNATEHTYRPALQTLFNTLLSPATATNEPKHAIYGAPDFVIQQGSVPIGHIEAKDVGVDLAKIIADSEKDKPLTDNGRQLQRYRMALPNLLYTDGLEWYWFVSGQTRLDRPVQVGTWDKVKKRLVTSSTGTADLAELLQQFAAQRGTIVGTPAELAKRLAQIARWLHNVIIEVFKNQDELGDLHQQLTAFQETLLPTLKPDEFADMYAQTLVYGLFAARVSVMTKKTFTRTDAAYSIPKTNPFLRKLFNEIAGPDLDDRIAWLVDNCAMLLERTDMTAVLRDFGKATRQEDPVVHFYETFLAAYNPKLREVRGVYYTPEPVVSYIVRSVDALLRTRFKKPMGLADDKVVILDPATGTATFLYEVFRQIHTTLVDQGMSGTWNSYVATKLLPRTFGFELLMAPYTVAHLKMGLLLEQLGYKFGSNERLGIYLTNTLADAPTGQQALAFAQYIADEGKAANKVKHDMPVMIVLGNPPYSNRGMLNKGQWIQDLLEDYKRDLEETKLNLDDDFIKFIRFGQWRIDQSGSGVLAFITNNTYIDGITHRRMRQSLRESFTDIYILDLHGNKKKREISPDGSTDENVFDIQQGVALGIFVKESGKEGPAKIHHTDLWGLRENKYSFLTENDIFTTNWNVLDDVERESCLGKFYFFTPKGYENIDEYCHGWNPKNILIRQQNGLKTDRDLLFIDFDHQTLEERIRTFYSNEGLNSSFRGTYNVEDSSSYRLLDRRKKTSFNPSNIITLLYRPFDQRWLYYDPKLTSRPAWEVMSHILAGENIGLIATRQVTSLDYCHVLCSTHPIEMKTCSHDRATNFFPLYLYDSAEHTTSHGRQTGIFEQESKKGRRPNLSPAFINDLERCLGLHFTSDGRGDLQKTVGPEDVFHYMYSIFHSPAYRSRYAEFLKINFPHLPLTRDRDLFAALIAKGGCLVDLHLLRLPGDEGIGGNGGAKELISPGRQGITFPKAGSGTVDKIEYIAPQNSQSGRVTINNTQYFEGIEPETWEMHIGGYQPLDKWLKDRRSRTLTIDDVQHYLRTAIALRETRKIMAEIDTLVPNWPIS